jgi:hypothetical protein
MTMRENGRAPGRTGAPWKLIGIVAGILIVLGAAGLFLAGGIGGSLPAAGQGTPLPAAGAASTSPDQHYGVSSTGIRAEKIVYPPTVAVPKAGVFINISYPGAYTGNYTVNGVTTPVSSSADRLLTLENATGLVTITLSKADRSAKQVLEVGIWKNGQLLSSAGSARPHGSVTVRAIV